MNRRWRQLVALAVAASSLAILAAVTSASASSTRTTVGALPRLPRGTHVERALSADQPLRLTIALRSQDAAGLQAFATAVSTPGSPSFHHYLTVSQFAQRFGATSSAIAAVQSALRSQGLTVGQPAANDLSLPAHGTADQVEHAFAVAESQVALPTGRTAYTNDEAPTLPSSSAGYIQGVIGLDDVASSQPQLAGRAPMRPAAARARARARAQVATGGPQPCSQATGAGGYTADQIASMYGISAYYPGDEGAGETVGLFEQEPYDPTDVATYQACYGTSVPVTNIDVDGGPGAYASGDDDTEADLDIETIIGLAPKASIIVYQAQNDSTSAADILSSMVADDRAKVLSSSWGSCESETDPSVVSAENTLLQEAATQGQTFLNASGDAGSTQCYQTSGGSNDTVSVLDPAAQPFATGVGGTLLANPSSGQLSTDGAYPGETVWNDGGANASGTGQASGTGGGVSDQWPMPAYQSTAAAGLGVVQGASQRGCGGQYCREVPDVSADADPNSGYTVYVNPSAPKGGWTVVGGTSGSAPLWAAFLTLADASPTCRGLSLGFVNPSLYQIAGGAYATDFHDITLADYYNPTQPNNDTWSATNPDNLGSLYPVRAGYDMATGLGTPIANVLGNSLCSARAPIYRVSVASPGKQHGIVGHRVSLAVHAADSGGQPLSYVESGLPAGLTMSSGGLITGRPRTAGTSTVTVAAHDPFTNSGQVNFVWTVAGNPTVSRVRLSGLAGRRPKLAATFTAGRGAPALRSVSFRPPRGFSLAHDAKTLERGLSVKSGRRRLRCSVRVRHGVLTITLRRAARSLAITMGGPALSISDGEARLIQRHRVRRVELTFTTSDASRVRTTLRVQVRRLR